MLKLNVKMTCLYSQPFANIDREIVFLKILYHYASKLQTVLLKTAISTYARMKEHFTSMPN